MGAPGETRERGNRVRFEAQAARQAGVGLLLLVAACRPMGARPASSGALIPREPRAAVRQLSSDIKVVVSPIAKAERVVVQLRVGAGSAQDPRGREGLAHVVEHVLVAKAGRGPSGETLRRIVQRGGALSAWTTIHSTLFQFVVPPRQVGAALEVLAAVATVRNVEDTELDMAVGGVRDEIVASRSDRRQSVGRRLFAEAFPRQPLGRPVLGRLASLASLSPAQAAEFLCRYYRAPSLTISVAGPVSVPAMLAQVARAFGRRSGTDGQCQGAVSRDRSAERSGATAGVAEDGPRVVALRSPKRGAGAHLALGFRIPGFEHEDTPSLDVVAALLGQGRGCRLSRRSQLRLGLEEVDSFTVSFSEGGLLVVTARATPASLLDAVQVVMREIVGLGRGSSAGVEELERARAFIAQGAAVADADPERVACRLGAYQRLLGDADYGRVYRGRLRAVGGALVQRVVQRYLRPGNATLVVETPDADGQLEQQLRDAVLGVDREGRP